MDSQQAQTNANASADTNPSKQVVTGSSLVIDLGDEGAPGLGATLGRGAGVGPGGIGGVGGVGSLGGAGGLGGLGGLGGVGGGNAGAFVAGAKYENTQQQNKIDQAKKNFSNSEFHSAKEEHRQNESQNVQRAAADLRGEEFWQQEMK